MTKQFKTKAEALNFIKKLSFRNIRYNRVQIGTRGKVWWVSYE